MAKYRKLGRTSSQRKALLRNQVTALLNNGKIVTTEAKAKEIRKQAESLIALAVKEKDNFEEVTIKAKVAKKDENGNRVLVCGGNRADFSGVGIRPGHNTLKIQPDGCSEGHVQAED